MLLEHCWRTLMYLLTFWVEVACAALYLINKLPSPNWVMCPHFKKKKLMLDLIILCSMCVVVWFVHLVTQVNIINYPHKLLCVLVGYIV